MLTKFQSHLFNYCLDEALSYYGRWYKTEPILDEETISKICDLFNYSLNKEEEYEFESSVRGGNRYEKMSFEYKQLAVRCLRDSMIQYNLHYGKIRIDIREHRVQLRKIYIEAISSTFREKQLEGLAKARQHIRQEKEALLYEGQ